MSRHIDADAFIAEKREQYCKECARRKGKRNGKQTILYEIGEAPCRACGIDDMIDDIEDAPTADVAPVRHAHWEYHESVCTGEGRTGVFVCSACKAAVQEAVFDFLMDGFHKDFCGACGARMDEEATDGNP